jgi:hypothetical protein
MVQRLHQWNQGIKRYAFASSHSFLKYGKFSKFWIFACLWKIWAHLTVIESYFFNGSRWWWWWWLLLLLFFCFSR